MSDETKLDEIQILARQLREASDQPKGNDGNFLEQAQQQILTEKSKKAAGNLNQQENPPKPIMKNPIIDQNK